MKKLRFLSLTVVFALLCNSTVLAFHAPPWDTGHNAFSGDPGDTNTDPGDSSPGKCGSPVDVATGNFNFSARYLLITGFGPAIDLTLAYNSEDLRKGPFGKGWTHPYDQRLIVTTDEAQIHACVCGERNGKNDLYTRKADNTYIPPSHTFSALSRNPDETHVLRDENGTVRKYDKDGKLAAIVDRNSNALALSYDQSGFLTALTDASGRSLRFTKGADGRVESTTDPANRVLRYSYDSAGNLTQLKDPLGNTRTFQYNSSSKLTTALDALGHALISLSYDTSGRVVTLVEGAETWTFTYSPAQKRTTKRDSSGRTWTYDYNDTGNITKITDPAGKFQQVVYDANLNITQFTDKNGLKTNFTYDTTGNLLTVTDPQGNVRTTTYEPAFNLPLTMRDSLGNVTRFEYDSKGNLIRRINPAGSATTYQYNSNGQLTTITDAGGGTSSFTYDNNGNIIQSTDALGNSSSATFDVLGNATGATDAAGRSSLFTYDDNERLIKVTNPQGGVTTNSYDAANNRLAVTLPSGAKTAFDYDSFNRLVRVTSPLSQITTYSYDTHNNLVSKRDAKGQQISFTYDVMNRLITKSEPDDTVTYTYDSMANLLSLTDADSKLTFTYDSLYHVATASTGPASGQPATTLTYSYNANGNRSSMADTGIGVTNYTYDNASRLKSLNDPSGLTTTFQYDSLSRRTQMTRSGGTVTTYAYDAASHLTSLVHQSAAGSLAFNYTYDRIGNRVMMTDPAGPHSFAYDQLNQLTSASHPNSQQTSESYSYDSMENRTSSHLSVSYTYDSANRLLADATFTYVYDANGNLTSKTAKANGQTTTYGYDSENRLIRIDFPGGTFVTYRYDGLGRRIEKNVASQITRYVYDGSNIISEYAANGTVNARYIHGPEIDEMLAIQRGSTLSLLDSDGLGSIQRAVTGSTVSASFTYDSFGRMIASTGSLQVPYSFQGRELDQESGLYYYRARYYAPQTGRFMTEDPIGFSGSVNFYQFVGNNPVNALDPTGLKVGFWESLIPIWGSGKRAIEDFECGRWGWGLFNSALAISDVFLIKAAATAIAKGAIEAGGGIVARETAQVVANQAAGQAAERLVAQQLVAEGNTILGSQVAVRTSEGLRYVDHLIQTPAGEIIAVEVKSGGATRSASQMAKDAALSREGGVLTGGGLPQGFSKGDHLIVNTIERRVP